MFAKPTTKVVTGALLACGLAGQLASCAVAPVYPSATSEDRATLYFTSPYRESDFFAIERLAMLIFTADGRCEKELAGRVPLAKDLESGKPVYVAAGKTLYIKLWQRSSDAISHTVSQRSGYVSLTPAASTTYELRHIDNPSSTRIEAYQLPPGQKPVEISLDSWQDCKKTR